MYKPVVKNCPLQGLGGQFCMITITTRINIRCIVKNCPLQGLGGQFYIIIISNRIILYEAKSSVALPVHC